jgi:malate permease and related proteins
MAGVLIQIIPVILLLAIGKWLSYIEWFDQKTVEGLKQLTLNVILPAVLFISFLKMELQTEYMLLFIVIFLMLLAFYLAGKLVNRISFFYHPLIPYISTGVSFAFIGIPFFMAVYGMENLGSYALLGVGQEVFLWMFLFPLMRIKSGGTSVTRHAAWNIIKSPTLIAIFLGMILNFLHFESYVGGMVLYEGIMLTIEYLTALATPLILLIVGFGLTVKRKLILVSVKLLLIRLAIMFSVGYIVKVALIDRIIEPSQIFDHAFLTFLILPPPLTLPVFVSLFGNDEHVEIASNTVAISTIFSVVLYTLIVLL